MKVVINNCYGGFGLSPKAIELYLKKIGKDCHLYRQTGYEHEGNEEYTKTSVDDAQYVYPHSIIHVYLKDMGNVFNSHDTKYYWYETFSEDRSNKELIETIEELGCKISSGSCAELKIVDIPDDVEYTIDEYDGIESIHEVHRSW